MASGDRASRGHRPRVNNATPSATARYIQRQDHDQAFKNLILDYPREALLFFAESEVKKVDSGARVTPLRQEQLKDRLGDRFFELDVPLLVEWPDGRRDAIIFILEEETDPARFSIHRLGSYCLSMAELMKSDRVVPVVIFLKDGKVARRRLCLGVEGRSYLRFRYIARVLPRLPARALLRE